VEAALLQLPPGADKGAASKQQLQAWHERFKGVAAAAAGLEQLASAATTQYMDAQGMASDLQLVCCCVFYLHTICATATNHVASMCPLG
jgi:hypothetical protein